MNERIGPNRDVLIIGGGIAGMQAALLLAEKDHRVHVLESEPAVGGFFPLLDRTFPTNSCGVCFMSPTPPAYCPIYESDFHENIVQLTNCRLEAFGGQAGDFQATYVQRPRYVDPQKCTLCGRCAEVCPVVVDKKLGAGLEKAKAIDLPFPQAIPRTFTIDGEACTRCGDCLRVCTPGAISLDEQPVRQTLHAGAVVLGFGFEPFQAQLRGEYGFGRYQNVVSSIQYERMLSLSGPSGGNPVRPSDGERPGKVAFIQCVGSRDRSCGRDYCSSICCMYATKQAMISKDRDENMETAIFYMDVRPMGKDYERYYERAKSEYGIRYQRSAVSTVRELRRSGSLRFAYMAEGAALAEEDFDLVVLSVGFSPPADAARVAGLMGVELDEYGFCRTDELLPTATSVPGVFVAGAFRGPKDIPETVVEASSAAADVSGLLDAFDNSGTSESPDPIAEQTDEDETLRIGVFFCDSRGQLSAGLDLQEIEDDLANDPEVVLTRRIDVTSPRDGVEQMRDEIDRGELNRVVLAGYHGAALAKALRGRCEIARAGIGEQCINVHLESPRETGAKARNLIHAAVMKVKGTVPGDPGGTKIDGRVLVVGGGLAGLTSSLALADQGMRVTLVEKEPELGGNALSIHYTLMDSNVRAHIGDMVSRAEADPLIEIYKSSQLLSLEGTWGSFRSQLSTGEEQREVRHGAIILATGAQEALAEEYLYGTDERILTQRSLERMIAAGEDGPAKAKSVVMIQCVGSRDEKRPYCSRVCCGQAVKNARRLKGLNPENSIYVLYRDVRTYGFYEKHYQEARELGVVFVHYESPQKPVVSSENGTLLVAFHDPVVNERRTLEADLLVLSGGIIPNRDNQGLAEIAGLDLTPDGFFAEANPKAAPLDSVKRGIYFCGLSHSPNYCEQVICQAKAAAARASALLWRGYEPLPENQAYVRERRCSGCGLCVTACPYDAREIDEVTAKARVLRDLCRGCGTCAVVCPNGASQQHGFESAAVMEVVDTVVG